ncbi:SMI1/KNR4 family protein [Trinickia sp. LjRoot230]|uniref:SMI1/KNR4 family protein n=1 Tax=Trinickia sp. LjRoot230 TaxID=3342288 RepID=UPI003ECC8DA8
MSKLKLMRLAKPLTEHDIENFDNQFGIRMPADLRRHYLQWNGGFPDCFKMCYIPKGVDPCDANGVTLNGFYPIKYPSTAEGSMLEENYIDYTDTQSLFGKTAYIPFAFDVSGYPLLMKFKDCAIYLLNRDVVDDDGHEVIEFVAPSLQEFIDGLIPGDEFEDLISDC